jgi:phosphatidylserine/phosphatidylglycerophosphate/cardiolipin synthase-like enzyme
MEDQGSENRRAVAFRFGPNCESPLTKPTGTKAADAQGSERLLTLRSSCWRIAHADRAALLVDAESYIDAMSAAIRNAQHSILLLGWDFDPLVPLKPSVDAKGQPERFCDLLDDVVSGCPGLSVHILIWDMTWSYAVQRRHKPQQAALWLPNHRVHYRVDGEHPAGAAHHQKVLVVDDSIAFCGGADFTRNRWDTPAHLPLDRRRRTLSGSLYAPRHDVVMAVDGAAAAALGELARERWFRATGDHIAPPATSRAAWPNNLPPDMLDLEVAIARTEPAWRDRDEIREIEALYFAGIAAAERWIYLENQYVTSPAIGEALARRLAEPVGPEVIIVCPAQSGGRFDRLCMDHARNYLLHQLRSADRHDRFRAYAAMADENTPITIHSKVMIVDDRLVRVGSANLNNRSFGLDTECDIAVEAEAHDREARKRIRRFLMRLLGEHTGSAAGPFEGAFERTGSLRASIGFVTHRAGHHLQPFDARPLSGLDRLMGATHLLDPNGVADNWRPWRRLKSSGRADRLP